MAKVTVYYSDFCPFCIRAITLLRRKGANFKKINVGMNAGKRAEMIKRSNGGRSVPQIFVGDQHIGGCDEMMALDRAGKLDPLLAG